MICLFHYEVHLRICFVTIKSLRKGDYFLNEDGRFFEKLSICLQREGFTVQPQENGLLPVLNNGMPLCRIAGDGGIRYKPEDITDADMEFARDLVAHIAGVTVE